MLPRTTVTDCSYPTVAYKIPTHADFLICYSTLAGNSQITNFSPNFFRFYLLKMDIDIPWQSISATEHSLIMNTKLILRKWCTGWRERMWCVAFGPRSLTKIFCYVPFTYSIKENTLFSPSTKCCVGNNLASSFLFKVFFGTHMTMLPTYKYPISIDILRFLEGIGRKFPFSDPDYFPSLHTDEIHFPVNIVQSRNDCIMGTGRWMRSQ